MKKPLFISRLSGVLCIAAVAASGFIGCEKAELFNVNSPENILDQIDSIQAEKDKKAALDSVTNLTIVTSIVGAEDCSAAWWSAFTDYFTIPSGKRLHLKFINHSSGENNWNNWNLAVANAERDASGYAEYFVLRSDAYGWGGMMDLMDCSLYTRDIYRCFGFELPRNTSWQIETPTDNVDLSGMTDEEKRKAIDGLEPGTLLMFSGHITMYIGSTGGKQYVISDMGSAAETESISADAVVKSIFCVSVNSLDVRRRNGNTWLSEMKMAVRPWKKAL